ncbi:hypothetical protein EDB84DRAFT_1103570 [Lactarius hengduanensis]|nr:hypothetical protein EDB84DRAFT_1103570 [Lactarius hengduanensis]
MPTRTNGIFSLYAVSSTIACTLRPSHAQDAVAIEAAPTIPAVAPHQVILSPNTTRYALLSPLFKLHSPLPAFPHPLISNELRVTTFSPLPRIWPLLRKNWHIAGMITHSIDTHRPPRPRICPRNLPRFDPNCVVPNLPRLQPPFRPSPLSHPISLSLANVMSPPNCGRQPQYNSRPRTVLRRHHTNLDYMGYLVSLLISPRVLTNFQPPVGNNKYIYHVAPWGSYHCGGS